MGVRAVKTGTAAAWLRSHTGIPDIHTNAVGKILAPYPYGLVLVTDRSHQRHAEAVNGLPDGLHAVVRANRDLGGPEEWWATLRLPAFSELVRVHYETVVLPRLENRE